MKKSVKKAMKTVVEQQKEFRSVIDVELPSVMIGITPDGRVAFYVTNGDPDDVFGLVSAVGTCILSGQLAASKDGQASESSGRVNVH